MGQAKLLMPWGETSVIGSVLSAWVGSVVDEVIVVVRKDDEALRRACSKWSARVIAAEFDPPDMKASVQVGLNAIAAEFPAATDRCLIAPADLPTLKSDLIDDLIRRSHASRITIPSFGGKQGHPIVIPWSMTERIKQLGDHEGLHKLVKSNDPLIVEFPVEMRPKDMDTPEAYRRLKSEHE